MTRARVLLTGATGLIGRHAVAPLRGAGYDVIALSRSGRDVAGAAGLAADLLNPDDLRRAVAGSGAAALVHLAWADGPDRWTTPANLDWAAATLTLLRAFADAGGRRALLAGSCAEYDWSQPVLSETSPLNPATLYGAAKARTGQLAVAAAPALGISLAWARPFFVYGPAEPKGRLFGDLIRGIAAGLAVDCTDGEQRRDFLQVADLGAALAAVLTSTAEGAVNVASGKAVAVKDMILTVARQMGRPELVRLGARPRPAGDPACLQADVTRLRDEVGFTPRFDVESGIADVLRAEGVLP